ncbi:MAG: acylneuraminate cytidylyltransferase family protein [Candidatus Thermoplasmatota archaeon]|nr:acylneuraminate cytidylyltransferase family protein [Candidatus Thermoplasmatota archaeon]MCG2735876.1 acylneuraminate cytidylyltransferase family protein [Candidatus Methanoperedenaceae archaeon]MCG2827458.1 acylneuraminate cytidylyltransferase family protein [Thermoplasmatales archaeon]
MKILGTICARGGSKGLPKKNIMPLAGKPLIAYTINIALKWEKMDKLIVSTDNEEIANVSKKYGVDAPFMRPAELATDTADKLPVIQHAVKFCEKKYNTGYDVVVDLDPTAPLRKISDLDKALNRFLNSDADVLYSVCRARKSPYFNMVELDENGYAHLSKPLKNKIIRRQDSPEVYDMNASIYIYNRDFLLAADSIHSGKAIVYVMDDISAFDIDREIDFQFIEFLLEREVFRFD